MPEVISWTHQPGDRYVVTGVDTRGKRFSPIVCANWRQAESYNIYKGTRWLLRDGRRTRLQRVWN